MINKLRVVLFIPFFMSCGVNNVQAQSSKSLPPLQELSIIGVVEESVPVQPNEQSIVGTLLGVDVDGDGVKDDVERYILSEFPGDENINLRNSLYVISNGFLGILQDEEISDTLYYARNIYVPSKCIENDMSRVAARRLIGMIKAKTLNSKDRIEAYYSKIDSLSDLVISSRQIVELYSRRTVLETDSRTGEKISRAFSFCQGDEQRRSLSL